MKRFIFTFMCSVNSLILAAQVEVNLSQINGTTWYRSNSNGYSCSQTYTKKQISRHSTFIYMDRCGKQKTKEYNGKIDFYLSNAFPTTFDHSKVGVSSKGKYIIEKSNNGFYCFKILVFSNKKMVLIREIRKSDNVIGQPEPFVYYRR